MSDPLQDVPGFLREVEPFAGLDDEDRRRVAGVAELRRVAGEEAVFEEGAAGDALYVVVYGQVRVERRAPDATAVELAVIGPRGVFGEMALYDDVQRSATVRALSRAATLLALRRDHFLALLRDRPEIALRMLAAQNRRIRQLNDRLVSVDAEARRYAPTLDEVVTDEYPHPIAQVFQDAHALAEPRPRLQRWVELLEVVLLYVSSLARASYVAAGLPSPEIDHELCVAVRGMTLGQHLRTTRLVGAHLAATHGHGGIAAALRAWLSGRGHVSEHLDRLLQIRNDLKHGAEGTLDTVEITARLEEFEPRVRAILESIEPLCRFPLLHLQAMNYVEGAFRYTALRCRGAFRTFRAESLTVAAPHELERLYAYDAATGALVPLFPWMLMHRCEVCGDRDVFFARNVHPRRVELIEFERGHTFAFRAVPAGLAALLDGFRERIRGTEHDLR